MRFTSNQDPEIRYRQIVLTILMGILVLSAIYYHGIFRESINVITWDVFGYYVYLPAVFEYGDLSQFAFVNGLNEQYKFSSDIYQINADRMPIYTMGLALLMLPFFLIAHLIASLNPGWASDGLSAPYQWMIVLGCLFWVCIGLFSLWKWLSHYFDKKVVAICLSLIVLGTNLFCYTTVESGMPHAFLFGLYAVLLQATHRWHASPSTKWSVIMATCMALLCLSRPSEIVCFLIPLFYPLPSKGSFQSKWAMIRLNYKQVVLIVVVFLIWMVPQVGFWLWRTGQFVYNAYSEAGHQFDFDKPHIIKGLFSYRKGWLVYTPLMLSSILGIVMLWMKRSNHRWMVTFFFILNLYFVLSWHIWWYAGSFGMRALVQSYALLSFPIAFLLNEALRKRLSASVLNLIIVTGILLNLFQTWQYTMRILTFDEITETFYWKSFLKTSRDKTLLKFLDSDESAPQGMEFSRLIEKIDAEEAGLADTLFDGRNAQIVRGPDNYSITIRHVLDKREVEALSGSWIRVEANAGYQGTAFTEFNASQLVLNLQKSDGSHVKWVGVRFPRFVSENQIEVFGFDFSLPDNLEVGDQLLAYIHNGSPDLVFVEHIQILALNSN